MADRLEVIKGLEIHLKGNSRCVGCPYPNNGLCGDQLMADALALLKAQEPRVMSLDLPEAEWHDKVIWLEIKGKKPTPCLFRECSDRMMFGHYERLMYFDVVGSCQKSGYMLKNYGVKWRCWTSRPTDAQMEAEKWES